MTDATRDEAIQWCIENKVDFTKPVFPPPDGWMWGDTNVPAKVLSVRCGCLKKLKLKYAYRCFYCSVFFCKECAELHFGQTVKHYKREIKCPYCGSTKLQDVEAERQRERDRQDTCCCMMYPFPHRKGSLRACEHHPNKDELTYEEQMDYEACLMTPRSA